MRLNHLYERWKYDERYEKMQSSQVLPGERGLLHGIRARHVWTQHCGTDSLDRAHLEIAFLTCHRLCQNTAPSCLAKFNQKIYIFGKYNVLIIGCFQRANLIFWVGTGRRIPLMPLYIYHHVVLDTSTPMFFCCCMNCVCCMSFPQLHWCSSNDSEQVFLQCGVWKFRLFWNPKYYLSPDVTFILISVWSATQVSSCWVGLGTNSMNASIPASPSTWSWSSLRSTFATVTVLISSIIDTISTLTIGSIIDTITIHTNYLSKSQNKRTFKWNTNTEILWENMTKVDGEKLGSH